MTREINDGWEAGVIPQQVENGKVKDEELTRSVRIM